MAAAVLAERLTKDFQVGFWRKRPHRAVDHLSLEIPFGHIFGLLGPNGAGKSTTLKLLLNLIWPTSGRAVVLGEPPGSMAARRRLGFLPENPAFYDHLSAEELLAYFAGLFGYRGETARRRANSLLDQVGLGADRRRPLRQFSKGMLQRVGLAQALVNDPELVILDEPMSGLDPIGRRDVRELILHLRDAGRTVVISSHVLSDAELLCSRVGILAKGRLVAVGGVSELTGRAAAACGGGWEIVISHLTAARVDEFRRRVRRLTVLADNRHALDVRGDDRPERLIADLWAAGGHLISVTPLKATLEDAFTAVLHENPEPRNPGT